MDPNVVILGLACGAVGALGGAWFAVRTLIGRHRAQTRIGTIGASLRSVAALIVAGQTDEAGVVESAALARARKNVRVEALAAELESAAEHARQRAETEAVLGNGRNASALLDYADRLERRTF
jgi:hypothetical protein